MSKILVTDGNYPHTLGIIRSLSILGNNVDFIGSDFCLSSFTKYGSKCSYKKNLFNEKNIEKFLTFLRKEKYDFLIPIGAESVNLINKYRKKVSKETVINLAPYESILICLSKEKTLNFAKDRGIEIPKGFTNNFINKYLAKNKKLPCKLVVKSKFEITNKKVEYINTLKDYINLKYWKSEILIQEYIKGYGIGFFAIYDKGYLKKFFMHKRLRERPVTGGSSVFAKSIFDKEVFKLGKLILDDLNWHGVAMVEFKKEIKTKKLYLMEVNPKFWGSHDLAIASGLNFAKEYISISPDNLPMELKSSELISYKLDKRFQWPVRDIISSLFKPIRLIKSLINFLDPKVNNNLFLNDPMPSLYLILSTIFSPIIKTKSFQTMTTILYRIKNYGIKISIIRLFTEISGIPFLRHSEISDNIAIGMQPKLLGYVLLKRKKYNFILNLTTALNDSNFNNTFNFFNIPIKEYSSPTFNQLNLGADYIHKLVINNEKIYIHCREGISRAPTILVAYYLKYKNLDINQAIQKIVLKRKYIKILDNQLLILKKFEKVIQKETI